MNKLAVSFSASLLVCGMVFIARATTQTFDLPIPTDYPDTESSLTMPFSGWDEKTRHFLLAFEVVRTNTVSSCIQCAFGTDTNADGDLAPEETDLVLGIDCAEPFVRDERNETPYQACLTPGMVTSTSSLHLVSTTFDYSRSFSSAWNVVKVTTRNLPTNALASVLATFRNNPTLIILR